VAVITVPVAAIYHNSDGPNARDYSGLRPVTTLTVCSSGMTNDS
jgi:hypothetical protein